MTNEVKIKRQCSKCGRWMPQEETLLDIDRQRRYCTDCAQGPGAMVAPILAVLAAGGTVGGAAAAYCFKAGSPTVGYLVLSGCLLALWLGARAAFGRYQ